MKRPEQKLLDFLQEHKLTIAFAESMTCGMAAMRIGNVSGTSDVFAGGIVCYKFNGKNRTAENSGAGDKKYTAESQQVTNKMAQHLTKKMRTDISAAITGLAAPGGSETKQKPVGTVFISVYLKGKLFREKKKFNGSPLVIKEKACSAMFIFTLNVLRKKYRK